MSTAPLDVDTDVYVTAGAVFLEVDDAVCDVVTAAATAAGAGAGMAGTDSGGVNWAARYDEAARAALTAGATLVDGLGRIGELLDRSGANHAEAETSSTAGGPPSYPGGGGGVGAVSVIPALPPSANATDDDPPAGWFLVAHLLEYTWPNGHQDRLRAVGAGWIVAARGLTDAADRLTGAIGDVSALQSPEVDAAVGTCTGVQQSARTLAGGFTALGGACHEYAGYLDRAHSQVVAELAEFAAESVVIQLVAAAAAVPSAGGSEAAGQTLQAGRVALAVTRIGRILETLLGLVGRLVDLLGDVALQVYQVHTDLQAVLAQGATDAVASVAALLPPAVVPYDLAADEGNGRGHTIRDHVGKTDDDLKNRSNRSRYASSFGDQASAALATASNIAARQADIDAWLASGDTRDLALTMMSTGVDGRVWDKRTESFLVPTSVTTVLRKSSTGYFVLTSFPDVRS